MFWEIIRAQIAVVTDQGCQCVIFFCVCVIFYGFRKNSHLSQIFAKKKLLSPFCQKTGREPLSIHFFFLGFFQILPAVYLFFEKKNNFWKIHIRKYVKTCFLKKKNIFHICNCIKKPCQTGQKNIFFLQNQKNVLKFEYF